MFETIGAALVVIACAISVLEEVYYYEKCSSQSDQFTEYTEGIRSDTSDTTDDEFEDNYYAQVIIT